MVVSLRSESCSRALAPIDVQPALDASAIADRPRLEHQHAQQVTGRLASRPQPARCPGRPEPSHQVIALDHQILDQQVRIGDRRKPARQSLTTGVEADGPVRRVLDDVVRQEPIQAVQASAIDAFDEAALQGGEVAGSHRLGCPRFPRDGRPSDTHFGIVWVLIRYRSVRSQGRRTSWPALIDCRKCRPPGTTGCQSAPQRRSS